MKRSAEAPHPITTLGKEDLELVARLVLASGSLKDVAGQYDVSYPTIRGRIDRLIERLSAILAGRRLDPMAELLARMVERGELGPGSAGAILDLHRDLLRSERAAAE